MVQNARNEAAEAYQRYASWKSSEEVLKPRMTSPHVVYDHRTATFDDQYETTQSYTRSTAGGNFISAVRSKSSLTRGIGNDHARSGSLGGIDLGVNNLAVGSTDAFWTDDEFDHWQRKCENRCGDRQECGTQMGVQLPVRVGRIQTRRVRYRAQTG